jgi:hypothetical protein
MLLLARKTYGLNMFGAVGRYNSVSEVPVAGRFSPELIQQPTTCLATKRRGWPGYTVITTMVYTFTRSPIYHLTVGMPFLPFIPYYKAGSSENLGYSTSQAGSAGFFVTSQGYKRRSAENFEF